MRDSGEKVSYVAHNAKQKTAGWTSQVRPNSLQLFKGIVAEHGTYPACQIPQVECEKQEGGARPACEVEQEWALRNAREENVVHPVLW